METGRRRERSVEGDMPGRTRGEQLLLRVGDGGPADFKKTKGQGREHLCDTGMPVRNGNFGTDRNTIKSATSVRKQLDTKNSKGKDGRQEKNCGVK